jgi:uncharacterized protein
MSTVAHPSAEARRAAATRVAAALRTEAGLARVALGVAAIHTVDDNFLQPERGTSAADHLWGGLIQVGLFALFAWAYPRMRAGLRATLAIFVGLFMVTMSFEAVNYLRESSLSGDDYTGLLMIPAGLLLAGVGAVTLWRTRKGGGVIRRYLRRAVLAVGFALGAFFVIYPVSQSYVITHTGRAVVPPENLGAYEDVSFTTSDGLKLVGWYVPSKNGAAVVSFPGRKGPQKPARLLAQHGYGVLLFDRRGEGESEGDPNLFGWQGTRDIEAAVAYLKTRSDVDDDRIGGLGLSVGGEMMLQEAAETDDLKAIVSEGAGVRSIREAVHVPGAVKVIFTQISAVSTLGTMVFTSNLPPRGLNDLSDEITEPLFVIYSDKGQGGETISRQYHDAAKGPKELWAAPGGHTGAIDAAPAEYERRVVGFFDRTIGAESR